MPNILNQGRASNRCPFYGDRLNDVWEFDKVAGNNLKHQNQKPIDLIEQCINKHSQEEGVVFDGFIGSGTTAIACMNTNRNYIGYELDKDYYNIAIARIEKHKEANKLKSK